MEFLEREMALTLKDMEDTAFLIANDIVLPRGVRKAITGLQVSGRRVGTCSGPRAGHLRDPPPPPRDAGEGGLQPAAGQGHHRERHRVRRTGRAAGEGESTGRNTRAFPRRRRKRAVLEPLSQFATAALRGVGEEQLGKPAQPGGRGRHGCAVAHGWRGAESHQAPCCPSAGPDPRARARAPTAGRAKQTAILTAPTPTTLCPPAEPIQVRHLWDIWRHVSERHGDQHLFPERDGGRVRAGHPRLPGLDVRAGHPGAPARRRRPPRPRCSRSDGGPLPCAVEPPSARANPPPAAPPRPRGARARRASPGTSRPPRSSSTRATSPTAATRSSAWRRRSAPGPRGSRSSSPTPCKGS